jgi:hypothetical protein
MTKHYSDKFTVNELLPEPERVTVDNDYDDEPSADDREPSGTDWPGPDLTAEPIDVEEDDPDWEPNLAEPEPDDFEEDDKADEEDTPEPLPTAEDFGDFRPNGEFCDNCGSLIQRRPPGKVCTICGEETVPVRIIRNAPDHPHWNPKYKKAVSREDGTMADWSAEK